MITGYNYELIKSAFPSGYIFNGIVETDDFIYISYIVRIEYPDEIKLNPKMIRLNWQIYYCYADSIELVRCIQMAAEIIDYDEDFYLLFNNTYEPFDMNDDMRLEEMEEDGKEVIYILSNYRI